MGAMLFSGIDPGTKGGFVLLDEAGRVARAVAWSDGDPNAIARAIQACSTDIALAALEKVAARPAQGVTATFVFGAQFGIALGVLAAFRVPHILVRPQEWQASCQLSKPARLTAADVAGVDKDGQARDEDAKARSAAAKNRRELKRAIYEHAMRRWPDLPITKQDEWALADAAFLADHARRFHLGERLERPKRAPKAAQAV